MTPAPKGRRSFRLGEEGGAIEVPPGPCRQCGLYYTASGWHVPREA